MYLIYKIVISALGFLIAARLVPGISVKGFGTAILAAIVFGILNATLGNLLKILTFPLSILTFGLFLFVINALIFWASSFIKGFTVEGWGAAFLGSLIVTAVSFLGKALVK